MKDSKTIRNEHQSFVDAWKKIQEDNSSTPVEEGYKDVKKMLKTNKGYKKESKILVRKSNAFTALAEKYNMSPKQFGRYVEANQHLFDIPTRKKAILANKFQGFKETKEWDEFFGDLELVESEAPYVVHTADMKGNTPAWQGYVEGKLNEVTGEPLYVAGEDIQEMDNMGGPAAIAGIAGAGILGAKKVIQGVSNLRKNIKHKKVMEKQKEKVEKGIANADKEYKDLLERMKKTQELNIKLEEDANAALSLVNDAVKTINLKDDEIERLEKENAKLAEEIKIGKSKGSQVNVEKPMVLVNVETNVHYRGSYNTILILEDGTKRYIKVSTFDKDLQVTKKAQSLIGKKIKVTSWDPVNEPGKWSKQGYFRNIYEYK